MDLTFRTDRGGLRFARVGSTCLAFLTLLSSFSPQAWCAEEPAGPKKPAQFGPGVRIDWQKRLVELDAEVVLRQGPLELLACSPQTREHESILRVHAKPLHVYQAMGLIGLTPGSPMKFDKRRKRWRRPTGDSLMLSVRCSAKGATSVVPLERWLRDVEHKQPPRSIEWIFAGSRTLENGKFGADLDGTVVCVVDFDTALITVSDLHTADNEALWLEANTEAIPPVGTRCTLLIRGVPDAAPVIRLSIDGSLRHGGKLLAPADVTKLAGEIWSKRDGLAVILEVEAGVSKVARQNVLRALNEAGIERTRIEVRVLSGATPRP
ncbi:MAG: hypothetical protein IID33_15010 [Planctomycetes bacterium]|nr:hypothetical protein [Planctomycetota bacterium]